MAPNIYRITSFLLQRGCRRLINGESVPHDFYLEDTPENRKFVESYLAWVGVNYPEIDNNLYLSPTGRILVIDIIVMEYLSEVFKDESEKYMTN